MSKDHYEKLLRDNVTKTYQKPPSKLEASINLEAKSISTKLKISDIVKCITRRPAFVTFRGHKDNFRSNPTFCLINPSKIHSDVFLRKVVRKIWSKFTGEHPCRSAISTKLLCNFIEIALRHGCSPVNLLHIFRIPFLKNTSGRLLLKKQTWKSEYGTCRKNKLWYYW